MAERSTQIRRTTSIAAFTAGLMIAHQVAGKAIRDALFLSEWPVSRLPTMLAVSALVSLLVVVKAAGVLGRVGPRVAVPRAFALSGVLLIGESFLFRVNPAAGGVLLFVHMAALGGVLISWFWSLVNECFDPHTARRSVATIAAGGTAGGYIGGVGAALIADDLGGADLLLVLAALHLITVPSLRYLACQRESESSAGTTRGALSGVRDVLQTPYLRTLATLVLFGTMAAACVDFVFKSQAALRFTDEEALLRFFATYYTGISFATFLLQALVGRRLLNALGVVGSASLLPITMALTTAGALFVPGLPSALAARAGEATFRSSVFRAAYELLYVPVDPKQKRSAKLWVDVGADRLGDALAGLLITALVFVAAGAQAERAAALLGIGFALMMCVIMARLQRRYVRTLQDSLLAHAEDLDIIPDDDAGMHTILVSRSAFSLAHDTNDRLLATRPASVPTAPHPALDRPGRDATLVDPVLAEVGESIRDLVADLRSGDATRVRAALTDAHTREVCEIVLEHIVPLLAWDAVFVDALEALRAVPELAAPHMIAALRDRDEVFAVRRRAPRVLSAAPGPRVVDALMEGLSDRRFEVRFQCGQALYRIIQRDAALRPPRDHVLARVEAEVDVERALWESHRLIDGAGEGSFVEDAIRSRVDRSLHHVFTLLALAFDAAGMRLALLGLSSDDPSLRGTAIEYLETALPPRIARPLLRFVEPSHKRDGHGSQRSAGEVLADLVASNRSLQLELERARELDPATSTTTTVER